MSAPKTTIDWLRFRTQADVLPGLEALRGLFGDLGSRLVLKHLGKGKDGWEQGAGVLLADMVIGRVDFGGQRGWVRWNVTGLGCQWVREWDAIDALEALPGSTPRRVDVALTTWKGEVTHQRVKAAHEAGRFVCGGRPPNLREITNSDPRAGRTCEVGKREKAAKFFRGYEKGFELALKTGALASSLTEIDGSPLEDIYRCEVEFKDEQGQAIPWDVIGQRDAYFAGAYPFCADLLPGVEADILQRRPDRAPQLALQARLANMRAMWGTTLYTALMVAHGDIGAVWSQICGTKHNDDLLQAGVLLAEHPWLTEV